MTSCSFRWGLSLFAGASAGLLSLPAVMSPAVARADDTPFYVMGGSGTPTPSTELVQTLESLYFPSEANFAGQPTFPDIDPTAFTTPEQFYPITGLDQDSLATSVSQGVALLDSQISSALSTDGAVGVFGESQSAVVASLAMEDLESTDPNANATFVLVGDLMNPDGGLFSRFAGLDLSALGIDFYGATPSDDFPTDIYTIEYDGYADFPKYPLDILSDLNAIEGLNTIHGDINDLTPADLSDAIQLTNVVGETDTSYFIIPTDDLPLLDPVRDIPVVGNPIADLLQPDLTYLVNLGYGDPLYGYSTDAVNEATTFGLFPDLSDIEMMPGLLVGGAEQGVENFIGDLTGTGPNPIDLSLSSLTDASSTTTTSLPDLGAELASIASDPSGALTDLTDAISTDVQAVYGTLQPTADILDAFVTSLPAYDLTLIEDNLSNPIDAIGLPVAADLGIGLLLADYESFVLDSAAETIVGSFGL